MAQSEILDILQKNPNKEYSARDLALILGIRPNTVTVNMHRLATIDGIVIRRNVKGRQCNISYTSREKEEELNELR